MPSGRSFCGWTSSAADSIVPGFGPTAVPSTWTRFWSDRHVGAVAPAVEGGYVLAAGAGFLFVADDGSVLELAQPAAGLAYCDRRAARPTPHLVRVWRPRPHTLFVTTALVGLEDEALVEKRGDGLVFAVRGLGARGMPCQPYRGTVRQLAT